MRIQQLVLLFFLILPVVANAEVHLISWQSQAGAPRVILPRLDNETPAQAVQRYQAALASTPGLSSLVPADLQLQAGVSQDLPAENLAGRVRLAFIANWFQDITPTGFRIQNNIATFGRAGADPYVIGLAADLGLSPTDAQDYRDQIAKSFSAFRFTNPVLVDEQSTLIAGHGRIVSHPITLT